MKANCIVCVSLTEKRKQAREINDPRSERIAYDQMREHLSRVKYRQKHGWRDKP